MGELIADEGWGVVYGGGRVGLMGLVADAALKKGAPVIGFVGNPGGAGRSCCERVGGAWRRQLFDQRGRRMDRDHRRFSEIKTGRQISSAPTSASGFFKLAREKLLLIRVASGTGRS